jgi:hypothetical protein
MALLELPDGNWVRTDAVVAVRIYMEGAAGPRVIIETSGVGHLMLKFESSDAAYAWAKDFGQKCQ